MLPIDAEAATIAAHIYPRVLAYIEKLPNLSKRTRKDKLEKIWKDIFIAATALAYGYGVASGNRGDFELIADHLPDNYRDLPFAEWKP